VKKLKPLVFVTAVVVPWLYFACDYALRMSDKNVRSGGFSDKTSDVFIYVAAAFIGLSLGWLIFHKSKLLALFLSIVGCWAGYWYVGFSGLLYVCGAGIDCI